MIELAKGKSKKSKGNGEDKELKEKMSGEEAVSNEEAKKKEEEEAAEGSFWEDVETITGNKQFVTRI